jgi:hypothetical protein
MGGLIFRNNVIQHRDRFWLKRGWVDLDTLRMRYRMWVVMKGGALAYGKNKKRLEKPRAARVSPMVL